MTRWTISDTHFGHQNSWKIFKLEDGSPLRPFNSTEEMDEAMVENWNRVVGVNDTVYHLGDVVINKKYLPIIGRLNGKKKLIMGNHDIFGHSEYLKYFYDIVSYRVMVDRFVMSHIPLHPEAVTDRFKVNVHGHYHANQVMWTNPKTGLSEPDPRYFCVCVEQTNYTPISLDELDLMIKERWEKSDYKLETKAYGNGSGPG